jgi:hypothetical protein
MPDVVAACCRYIDATSVDIPLCVRAQPIRKTA